jgi:predicted membrane protein
MPKLKRRKKVQEPETKEQKLWKWFYVASFFAGSILMIFEIGIYRITIIDFKIPLLVILLFTGLTYIPIKNHYQNLYQVKSFFYPLMQSMISFGFIACYLFMAINYYGAEDDLKSYEFHIREKSTLTGSKGRRSERKPVVRFDYFGFEKELVFGFNSTDKVNNSDRVILTVKEGALGYDVIDSYDVK